MKALSVRQPNANWIASGQKPIECRTWGTGYRGPLLICASAHKHKGDGGQIMPCGVMICVVDLIFVRPMAKADLKRACMDPMFYIVNEKSWILTNPRFVEQAPIKGRLHLFDVPDGLIKYL